MSTKPTNSGVKLTKSSIAQLAPPETGQRFVRDTELKGFAVRITSAGSKAFILVMIQGIQPSLVLFCALLLSACEPHHSDFLYIDLGASENPLDIVGEKDPNDPSIAVYFGDALPVYETLLGQTQLMIADDGREPFVPGLAFELSARPGATISVLDKESLCLGVHQQNPHRVLVHFYCLKNVGNTARVSVSSGGNVLEVTGVVKKSGWFLYWDSL